MGLLIVTTRGQGQSPGAPGVDRIAVLRRKNQKGLPPTAAEITAFRRQQAQEERQLEDNIPAHVPIKVKIKVEKEALFKDLQNEHWLRDLEIEVKNTGTKPIYFLDLQLHLLETGHPDHVLDAIPLLYGRTDLVSITEPLKPTDVPMKPGETHFFTIPKNAVGGWDLFVRDEHMSQPKKVRVIFQFINFGDGTGMWRSDGAPLPNPKQAASNTAPCAPDLKRRDPKDAKANWRLIALNSPPQSPWFSALPGIPAGKFFIYGIIEPDHY